MIKLIRVDSRLIHGQVITKWVAQTSANVIVIIDDVLFGDDFMKDIYVMAAPKDIEVVVSKVDSCMDDLARYDGKNVMVLFKDMNTVKRAYEQGFAMEKVQIGGLPGGPGRKTVYKAISLDAKDGEILSWLKEKNVELYLQMTPDDDPMPYEKIQNKI